MSMRIVRLSKIVPHTFTHQSTHARIKPSTSNSLKKLTFSQDWEARISYRLERNFIGSVQNQSFREFLFEELLERQKLSSEIKLRIESACVSAGVYRKRIVSKITFFCFEITDASHSPNWDCFCLHLKIRRSPESGLIQTRVAFIEEKLRIWWIAKKKF